MPRPRTATNILEAKGAFRKDPQRARPNEPKVLSPFPASPPDFLAGDECGCWREIVAAAPAGVLTGADVFAVELTARLLAELRRDGSEMPASRLGHLRQQLSRLGLDPSGRASLTVDQPKENEFADL